MQQIAERGSLELMHDPGDDRNPETYTVRLIENPRISGSLEVASDWFELDGGNYRLNGSQALTIKIWHQEYL